MAQLPQTSLIATACVDFTNKTTITILPENYSGDNVQTPSILPITITRPKDSVLFPFGLGVFTVTIGPFAPYTVTVTTDPDPLFPFLSPVGVLKVVSSDYSVSFSVSGVGQPAVLFTTPNALSNTITFHRPSELYKIDDIYELLLLSFCEDPSSPMGPRSARVDFTRSLQTLISSNNMIDMTNSVPTPSLLNSRSIIQRQPIITKINVDPIICNNVKVPSINILGQTLIDGSDVGDMIFTIGDEFSYCKPRKSCHNISCHNKCEIIYIKSDQLKTTTFMKCCPKMVSVVKGKDCTLYEKAIFIFSKAKLESTFFIFYDNLILYGMLKFILSRLLYGIFNINFLLRKFNEKFLEDLGNSRFCGFLVIFLDCNSPVFGFNKFFKHGKSCDIIF